MIRLNIHEAKTHLSRYLRVLQNGEKILLCKRNIPIAEIVPLEKKEKNPRPIGLAKGQFFVPEDFFKPLPEKIMDTFTGKKQ